MICNGCSLVAREGAIDAEARCARYLLLGDWQANDCALPIDKSPSRRHGSCLAAQPLQLQADVIALYGHWVRPDPIDDPDALSVAVEHVEAVEAIEVG